MKAVPGACCSVDADLGVADRDRDALERVGPEHVALVIRGFSAALIFLDRVKP